MSDQTLNTPGATATSTLAETAQSYCCECGTYDAHTIRCGCCGFDFRAEAEIAIPAVE